MTIRACPEMISDKQFLCGILILIYFLVVPPLAYRHDHPVSTVTLPKSASTVVQSTGSAGQDMAEEEVLALCGLADVQCDSEKIAPVVQIIPVQPVTQGVAPAVDGSHMATLRKVCTLHDLGEQCAKDLYAIAFHESRFDCSVVGDQGRSYGCFQIQVKMHKVSKDFARDFEKAANWSLERMLAHNYPKYRTAAVRAHNGAGPMAQKYATNVITYANHIK